MKFYTILFLSILFTGYAYGQKKGIEKLTKAKIDSLRSKHVDSILWYHSYCGECEILHKKADDIIKYYNCTVQSGYDLTYNSIIYKQKGKYFIINLDCNNSSIKRQLDTCNSISYFLSIIQTLNKRDKSIKEIRKKGKFLGLYQMDGGFEEADIYFNNIKQHVTMSDLEETNKAFRKYFWIPKQIELFKLIAKDIAAKK